MTPLTCPAQENGLQDAQKPVCLHFFQASSGREMYQNKGLLELQ